MAAVVEPAGIGERHEDVEARISGLMGVINAATAELVRVLAQVHGSGVWGEAFGIRSFEHWIAWQCGVSARRAKGLAKMARRVDELPACAALFDSAAITEDAMATIAARVPADRDGEIAELAPALLHSQLSRLVGSLPQPDPPKPADEPPPKEARREAVFGVDGEQWWAHIKLPVDEGALVEAAWTAARDGLFHQRHPDHDSNAPTRGGGIGWADGVVAAAEAALRGLQTDWTRPVSERHQFVMHIDHDTGEGELHQLGPVPDALRRFLSCDATCRAVVTVKGVPVAYSERTHTVSRRLRRLIERRDRGCRVPGCQQYRWLHIHHLRHWENGGATDPCNLCALCPFHHRMHHLGLLVITGDPTTPTGLTFTDRHGRPFGARPPSPPPAGRVDRDTGPRYEHPTGERLDTRWLYWQNLN